MLVEDNEKCEKKKWKSTVSHGFLFGKMWLKVAGTSSNTLNWLPTSVMQIKGKQNTEDGFQQYPTTCSDPHI